MIAVQAHVEYETQNRHYAHVDCPGHADYVKVNYFTCFSFLLVVSVSLCGAVFFQKALAIMLV